MKNYKFPVKINQLLIASFIAIYCCQLIAMPQSKITNNKFNQYSLLPPPIKPDSNPIIPINIDAKNQKLISYYIHAYSKDNQLSKLIKRSKYFLQHVITELKKRNLPKELALLPIIESAYQPSAMSNKGAYGIWQISYITGKRYGLIYTRQDLRSTKDSRSDLIASTNAALNYLEFLYERFDNDWLLALAAYNAGEGRISRAIKNNKYIGKNANYWTLPLPKQTKHYVPKLLALSIIFNNPKQFGLDLTTVINYK
jgi:membrane-bound lytic murein transglycosylase D